MSQLLKFVFVGIFSFSVCCECLCMDAFTQISEDNVELPNRVCREIYKAYELQREENACLREANNLLEQRLSIAHSEIDIHKRNGNILQREMKALTDIILAMQHPFFESLLDLFNNNRRK